MKQKDLAMILLIVFISAIFSYFISKALITPPKNRQQKVEVVQAISSNFNDLDSKYYNAQAFDPTKIIVIGQTNNTDPFKSNR